MESASGKTKSRSRSSTTRPTENLTSRNAITCDNVIRYGFFRGYFPVFSGYLPIFHEINVIPTPLSETDENDR